MIVPLKLRPRRSPSAELLMDVIDSDEADTDPDENIIVSLKSLNCVIRSFSEHFQQLEQCKKPNPKVTVHKRLGLCITVTVQCRHCSFTSQPVKLYKEVKTNKCGPASGELNNSLLIPALKTRAGPSDICFFLASLNISPPSATLLYKKLNKLCDSMVQINVTAMKVNQHFVASVNAAANADDKRTVHVQVDTSFNNRPQAGYEAATQSFTPLIEHNTNQKLVLALSTANKLCSKYNCSHNTDTCRKNYATTESIA